MRLEIILVGLILATGKFPLAVWVEFNVTNYGMLEVTRWTICTPCMHCTKSKLMLYRFWQNCKLLTKLQSSTHDYRKNDSSLKRKLRRHLNLDNKSRVTVTFIVMTHAHHRWNNCALFSQNDPEMAGFVFDLYFHVGDSVIKPSKSAKNLGVIIEKNLNMESQVTNICKSTHFHLRNIGSIRSYLIDSSAKHLVFSFITSRLDYCNSLVIGLPDSQINRLQHF